MSKGERELLRREECRGREGLEKAAHGLRADAFAAADVRSWTREFPWATLGTSALVGLVGGYAATRKLLHRRNGKGKETTADEGFPSSVSVRPGPSRGVVVERADDSGASGVPAGSSRESKPHRRGARRVVSTASVFARRLPQILSLLSAAGAHLAALRSEDVARKRDEPETGDTAPHGPSKPRVLSPEEAALIVAAMREERSSFGEPSKDPRLMEPSRGASTATASPVSSRKPPRGVGAWFLLRETLAEFVKDKAFRLSAALAYYTVFSLAPLLVIVIAIAGLVFAEQAIKDDVLAWMRETAGPAAASTLENMIVQIQKPASGTAAAILGFAGLFFGASGLFYQLKDALNTVWGVAPEKGRGIATTLKNRALAFLLVLAVGLLLVVSLVASALVAGLWTWLEETFSVPGWLVELANFSVFFAVITLLFALIYKLLPDARILWQDVWVGAAVTALLFAAGKLAIALYLGRAASSSTFAAAGSLAIILVWAYYSALIFLLGAEFTQVYARSFGSLRPPGARTR